MDWNTVIGSRGRAHFKPRPYTDRDGNDRVANEVDRFYDWDEKYFPVTGEFTDVTDSDLPF